MKQDELDELAELRKRVARTYHSHLAMAKRLQRRDRNWTFALVTLSCVSALSAVSLIAKVDLYGRRGDVLWAIIGVTTLAISLVVANANYRERSVEAFRHYRVLQRQWVNLDFAEHSVRLKRRRAVVARRLDREYQSLLDDIPNHSAADFFSNMKLYSMKNKEYNSREWSHFRVGSFGFAVSFGSRVASAVLTSLPLLLALASLSTLVPVAIWLVNGE